MKITLDNNCIVALENNEADAPYIHEIIALHKNKKITLRLATISASERQPGGRYASHFQEFQARVTRLGLATIETLDNPSLMLKHPAHWGMSYWVTLRTVTILRSTWSAGFITYYFLKQILNQTYCLKRGLDVNNPDIEKNWRNKRCDVLGLWSHIVYNGDIFVTADKRFLAETKRPKLIALGAGDILCLKQAVELLRPL